MTFLNNQNNNELNHGEIDLNATLNTCLRNRLLIVLITSISTISTIIFSYLATPIWQGTFNIVVNSEKKKNFADTRNMAINFALGDTSFASEQETQKLILQSPSVLKPVYNYVKQEYEKSGKNVKNMTFKSWLQSELDISFETGSRSDDRLEIDARRHRTRTQGRARRTP